MVVMWYYSTTMKTKAEPDVKFNLRIPAGLRRRLEIYQKKRKPYMSLNSVIVEAIADQIDLDRSSGQARELIDALNAKRDA
jgi:hypothetical protein